MGSLHYGSQQVFTFQDRALAHLRSVILGKLVLQESFAFTWNDSETQQNTHIQRSIWIHPGLTLQFEFGSTGPQEINRAWLEALTTTANSAGGLKLVPEPPKPASKTEG